MACKSRRKKAFLGAAISAGASLLSGVVGGISKAKQQKKQAELDRLAAEKEAQVLEDTNKSSYFTQAEIANEERMKLYNSGMTYAKGGSKRIGNGIKITDGGNAKPIGNGAHVLNGRSHSTGGIGIKTGSDSIEAEGGEVVFKDGNYLKILSDYPISNNGVSPAKKALANPNAVDQIYDEQERFKMKTGLSSGEQFACGGRKRKAALGDILKVGSQVASLAVPFASGITGLIATGKRKAPKAPQLYSSYRMPTRVDVGSQLSGVSDTAMDLRTTIGRNTESSAASVGRQQRVANQARREAASIQESAANKERDLIRDNLAREQAIANANIDKANAYRKHLTNFENKQSRYRADAINAMITGVGDVAASYTDRMDRKELDEKRLEVAREMSVRPNVNGTNATKTRTDIPPNGEEMDFGTNKDVLEWIDKNKKSSIFRSGLAYAKGGRVRLKKALR